MERKRVFSLSGDDASVEWTFYNSARGAGGQKRNKTASDVRVRHVPSGAVGQATESRSQLQNRRQAWRRMVDSPKFRAWLARKLAGGPTPEELVERDMVPQNLRIEHREKGKWVPDD